MKKAFQMSGVGSVSAYTAMLYYSLVIGVWLQMQLGTKMLGLFTDKL